MSVRQVVCHRHKEEITANVEKRVNGAKLGEQQYMPAFQRAVTEFMAGLDDEEVLDLEREQVE